MYLNLYKNKPPSNLLITWRFLCSMEKSPKSINSQQQQVESLKITYLKMS